MFWRKRSAEDFAEEIKAHLEFEAEDLKREGLSEHEAALARCGPAPTRRGNSFPGAEGADEGVRVFVSQKIRGLIQFKQ